MEVKLYKSPWRAIKLMLLCSIFVVGGILMLNTDTPRWVWYMNIGFFSLGYPVGLFHLFDRRPQIIINEVGIFDRTTYYEFINWSVIYNAYPISIHEQKFVCLIVDEKYEPSRRKGKVAKTISKLNKELGAQELNIYLGQIPIDEIKLTHFIRAMISAMPEERPERLRLGVGSSL